MKKILFVMAAFVFVVKFVNAQTEKGTQTLGFSLGFSNQNDKYVNYTSTASTNYSNAYSSFNIGPQYSYFIADKLDLGGSLVYRSSNAKNISDPNGDQYQQHNHTFGAGAYLRKYFFLSNKLGFRAGPYLGYNMGGGSQNYVESNAPIRDKNTVSGLGAGLNLDLVYYPSKHLGLSANIANLSVGHEHDSSQYSSNSSNGVSLTFATNAVQFYVFYVFGNK